MPLPLTISCSSKIQIGFTFLVPAHPGSPGQRAVKQVCVVCVLDLTWAKRCDELTTATDRLATIGAQNALTLLRLSFSSQKVLHLLRCSPSANNPALQTSDSHFWSAISKITNSALSDIPCYRLLCQLYMAAWGCKGCHCSQFLPFWLRQRAPFPSRTIVIVSLSY